MAILCGLLTVAQSAWAQSGPATTPEVVAMRAAIPGGLFVPSWDSLRTPHEVPPWFRDAKCELFMHGELYAVPAHPNEWYAKHMVGHRGITPWHLERFGLSDPFGYKDFFAMFTCGQFAPDEWADWFTQAGVRLVISTEHWIRTWMHGPQYRLSVAWQNVGYNQPTQPVFYLGHGMTQERTQ